MPKELIGNFKHGEDEIEMPDEPSANLGDSNEII